MRNRSPANSAASSPPVPARISRNRLPSSWGSLGMSRRCSSSSSAPRRGASSSSSSGMSSSRAVAASSSSARKPRKRATTGASLAYSIDRSRNCSCRAITSGCASRRPTSSWRSSSFSSLRRMDSFMGELYRSAADGAGARRADARRADARRANAASALALVDEQSGEGAGEHRIVGLGGLTQRLRGRVQQAIRERMGEVLERFVGALAGGQHAPRVLERLGAELLGLLAQRADRGAGIVGTRLGNEPRDLLLEQHPGIARRERALLEVLVDDLLEIVYGEEV